MFLGNTVGYRDHQEGMDKEVYKAISLKDLYARTGIQKADYNTIYQLMAVKKKHPEYLEQAETLLPVCWIISISFLQDRKPVSTQKLRQDSL